MTIGPKTSTFLGVGSFVLAAALQVSGFQNGIVAIGLGIAGLLFLILGGVRFATENGVSLDTSSWRYMPLETAARIAFKRLEGTQWVTIAKRQRTEEARLNHMATYLAGEGPVQGRKPPALHQPLTPLVLASGQVVEGGKEFRLYGNTTSQFFELRMARKDFRRAIRQMKTHPA